MKDRKPDVHIRGVIKEKDKPDLSPMLELLSRRDNEDNSMESLHLTTKKDSSEILDPEALLKLLTEKKSKMEKKKPSLDIKTILELFSKNKNDHKESELKNRSSNATDNSPKKGTNVMLMATMADKGPYDIRAVGICGRQQPHPHGPDIAPEGQELQRLAVR